MKCSFLIRCTFFLAFSVVAVPAQDATLRGRILDIAGAVIAGANVRLIDGNGKEKAASSDRSGEFSIGVRPGTHTLRISSKGFRLHESTVNVNAGRQPPLEITLEIALATEQVSVGKDPPINTNPEGNASAIVLGKNELKSLPDDPAELQAALQALAGPGAGPSGGEIFIDGFSGGKLPRKDSIREVRINQNPFSSEFDRPGFGRIEIFTKAGTDDWAGEIEGEFADEALNARNPFSTNRPPYQLRKGEGSISGPLIKNKLSFYTELELEGVDNNSLINAQVLTPGMLVVPLHRSVVTPNSQVDYSQRFDSQIGENHSLAVRFSIETNKAKNSGVGGYNLPSRAFDSNSRESYIRLTETAVLSPSVINEVRFQLFRTRGELTEIDSSPTVQVMDAFTSGGANLGANFNVQDRHEFSDIVSITRGSHTIRAGGRVRYFGIDDSSAGNFAGTFTFTSIGQYQNTILNLPGAVPTQFSIAGGEPQAKVGRWDVGLFFQDDVRLRPDTTLSFGLRYERQNLISSPFDLAPRLAIAFAPGAGGKDPPKTVFRAGFGVFYDRVAPSLELQARRYNGVDQKQFIVTDSTILDRVIFTPTEVLNVPTIEELTAFQQPQTVRVVDDKLRSPYTVQAAVSVERQLPLATTLSVSYIHSQTRRYLRSRNINAPTGGVRPLPLAGNVYQYESTARIVQNQIVFNYRSNPAEWISFFGNYGFGFVRGDSEGAGSFPADQFDLSGEYGNSGSDIRHRFTLGASIDGPFGLSFDPFFNYRSGAPFNITTGADINGDALFTDRPAFAEASEPGAIVTKFGTFDPTPEPGDVIIPRNFGRGPMFLQTNLRISREFKFGQKARSADSDDDDEEGEGKYTLEFSLQISNLFNRFNGGTPVGNLRSSFFGESTSISGNARRMQIAAKFSF